jgi:hypothetical protein
MYTIGTSGLKYLAEKVVDTDVQAALVGKLIGYVGTPAERTGDTLHPPAYITPYSVYFEVPAVASTGPDSFHIKYPITTAQMYGPSESLTPAWVPKGNPFNETLISETILPAGGLKDSLYAFPRGEEGDIGAVPTVDGLPYFARDAQSLYVYDKNVGGWVKVSQNDGIPVGGMILWPEALDQYNPTLPNKFVRADGSEHSTTGTYAQLYAVVKDAYEDPLSPCLPGRFRFPLYNGAIVRYLQ